MMVRKLLDIEKAMEIIEGFLKDNGIKYEFEPFYTRYGLRMLEEVKAILLKLLNGLF